MSNASKEAALKALHDAELALAAVEQAEGEPEKPAESGSAADEQVGAPAAVAEAPAAVEAEKPSHGDRFVDQGPTYLGPVAIKG